MLHITQFIKEHPLLWETLLTEDPYNLKVKRDEEYKNLILLMYDMINSDFSEPIVKEARGIIIDIEDIYNPIVVCHAFDKFFNYGESESAVNDIDWSTARVQEKVDGSICKLWYYNKIDKWILSSNSCIQANKAELSSGYNLEELFLKATKTETVKEFALNKQLDRLGTYMFELVSPYNQVVVQHKDTEIYFIGYRNIITDKEIDLSDCMNYCAKIPKSYSLSSLEDCIDAAKALNPDGEVKNEGFVVVDKNFNRIKIKSPEYVALHHAANGLSNEDIIHIVRSGEVDEVLTYFPKYEKVIRDWELRYQLYCVYVHGETVKAKFAYNHHYNQDRKTLALKWGKRFSAVFKILDMDWDWKGYIEQLTDKQLLKNIERH